MYDKSVKLNEWNEVKQITQKIDKKVYFKERDIFWLKIGENIGFEQNGKGNKFQRPVLVVKRYTNDMFLGIPLSTTLREGNFYFQFTFLENKISTALLVQHKLFSSKRFIKKIGKIDKDDFKCLKKKLHNLIFEEDFCPSKEGTIPKENCKDIIAENNVKVKNVKLTPPKKDGSSRRNIEHNYNQNSFKSKELKND